MNPAAPDRTRFLRFLAAGAVNSAFGFGVYSIVILLGSPVWTALLIATAAGVAFNFVTTGGYVFRDLRLARLLPFVLAYAVVFVVNVQLIGWLLRWIPGKIEAQAVLTIPMALFSYALMKLVFRAGGARFGGPRRKPGEDR